MSDLENIQEIEQEIEQEEVQEIEQENGFYYYEKIYDDKHLGSFTESTKLAYELGWQDNHVLITDTEVSAKNGWTYLKGYAPKKTTEDYFNDFKNNFINAVREQLELVATEKGFLGSVDCATYALSNNETKKNNALKYIKWRDDTETWFYNWLNNKLKEQAKIPTLEEVMKELPQIEW